jgi:hypothetical protein
MKNECALSYLFKYIENPNYKMGDTTDIEDYNAILGPVAGNAFLNYILYMYVFNLGFIALRFKDTRNQLATLLAAVSCILYITMLRYSKGEKKDTLQTANLIINTFLLGYFLYK